MGKIFEEKGKISEAVPSGEFNQKALFCVWEEENHKMIFIMRLRLKFPDIGVW